MKSYEYMLIETYAYHSYERDLPVQKNSQDFKFDSPETKEKALLLRSANNE